MDWDELKNLDLAEIGHWPRPAKMLVWGLMVLFIVYLANQLLIQDQVKKLNLAEREERTLKLQFEEKYRLASRLVVREQGEGPRARTAKSHSVAALLEQISTAGEKNQLEFLLFQPEPEVKKEHYTELPIRIRVAGNYHSFGHFVSELAGLPQAFSLQQLRISRGARPASSGAGATTTGRGQLVMELVVMRYRTTGQGG